MPRALQDQPPAGWVDWHIRGDAHYWCSSSGVVTLSVGSGAQALWRAVTLPDSSRPKLAWNWRLDKLELQGDRDDGVFPCQVIAVFDNRVAVHYTWSPVQEGGSVYVEPGEHEGFEIEAHYIVLEGRPRPGEEIGEWREQDRDLFADYARFIRTSKPAPTKVLLLGLQSLGQQHGCRSEASIRGLSWR